MAHSFSDIPDLTRYAGEGSAATQRFVGFRPAKVHSAVRVARIEFPNLIIRSRTSSPDTVEVLVRGRDFDAADDAFDALAFISDRANETFGELI